MVQFVWEFVARPDKIEDFERYYSPGGPWAELFSRNAGYQSTQLLRDIETAGRYLTIDRWDNVASYRTMRDRFADEHERLDRTCEAFTVTERQLGIFEEA